MVKCNGLGLRHVMTGMRDSRADNRTLARSQNGLIGRAVSPGMPGLPERGSALRGPHTSGTAPRKARYIVPQSWSSGAIANIEDAWTSFGLQERDIHDSLRIERGAMKDLNPHLTEPSVIVPKICKTQSLAQYKSWIGRKTGDVEALPWSLPTESWNDRKDSGSNELTPEQLENIDRAGWIYLLGDSALVESYRDIIEFCKAPFEAAVYAARKVVIEPGASLVVSGMPAVLLFEELEIHAPGNLAIYTLCRTNIGTLKKVE